MSPENSIGNKKRLPKPESTEDLAGFWLIHAHKGRDRHDEAARRLERYRYWLGVPATALSALAGTSLVAALGTSGDITKTAGIVAGLVVILAAVLTQLQTTYNFASRADNHRSVGVRYKTVIRELEEESVDGTVPHTHEWFDTLRARFDDLELNAPVVPKRIYDRIERKYSNGIEFVGRPQDFYGPRVS